MTTLEETIVRMVTNQIAKQVMIKLIKDEPGIVTIGFYKECRKRGMFLHTRFNYPVIPDSSSQNVHTQICKAVSIRTIRGKKESKEIEERLKLGIKTGTVIKL